MVVQLDTHQTSGEPFGLPWTSLHARRADGGSKSRFFRPSTSAPSSPPSVFQVLKGPVSSSSSSGGSGGSNDSSNGSGSGSSSSISSESSGNQNADRRLAKIQVEIQLCRFQSPTPTPTSASRPTPKQSISAPVVPRCSPSSSSQRPEERNSDSNNAPPSPPPSKPTALSRPLTETAPNGCLKEAAPKAFRFAPPAALPAPPRLSPRPAKRGRALDDVDGPGTGGLPCKKRRLRLALVTSRLSQPYSWPATHILNRESGDDAPMLSRFLKFAAMGTLKRAGHQSALVRKAAILNRVRIGVRQAAVLRGYTVLAGMAARGNSLSHGLQLVTTSSGATGARFPGNAPPYDHPYDLPYPIPPVWRPHTTAFHPSPSSSPTSSAPGRESSTKNTKGIEKENPGFMPATALSRTPSSSLKVTSPPLRQPIIQSQREEEEDVAFPSPDLETRYTDFSDDDMDDVYADFGVLFGSGSGSSESGSGSTEGTGGEHFYEEYLDELDGLRWVA
ncbi:hypothetical protein GGR53DRAFT_210996 [Hypoxylon sp. FL1150]|nr:hypothetical protein GGR53DRAFT_210996 [Hypoxylon sp. FL1150]